MPSPETPSSPEPDPIVQLGEYIRHIADTEGRKHFVTLLVGAGFSRSAGVPVAGEIIKELKAAAPTHPFLKNAGPCPTGTSEYAFLMEKLGSPRERAKWIKKFIDRARAPDGQRRLRINWSHLLLATLVEQGYVHRILTTNFDPLIVEALAVMGQEIRTYDLCTTGKYYPGTLDPASVIYLHGQMHSLFLANSREEMTKLRDVYPTVLQEALTDTIPIVVGYSGECDPVLDALAGTAHFPLGIHWSHFSRSGNPPGTGVARLRDRHGENCHVYTGCDSDTFMRKLVLEGMKLDLPDEVLQPVAAMRLALERITDFPNRDNRAADPVQGALELLRRVDPMTATATIPMPSEAPAPKTTPPAKAQPQPVAPSTPEEVSESARALPIQMAAAKRDWAEFDRLTQGIVPNPASILSRAVGNGLVTQANIISQTKPNKAIALLEKAAAHGTDAEDRYWLPVTWADALAARAKGKGTSAEAGALFTAAYGKYAEATRLKPDPHEAFYNWGTALSAQARQTRTTPTANTLLTEAGQKFAASVQIKPDRHDAFNNWGLVIAAQARQLGASPAADELWAEAGQKYIEAIRIKPDRHEVFYNWGNALISQASQKGDTLGAGMLLESAELKLLTVLQFEPDYDKAFYNLACLEALRSNIKQAMVRLEQWRAASSEAQKSKLDRDSDFNRIRTDPAFVAFRETLPD